MGILRRKTIGEGYLELRTYISDADFPGRRTYSLSFFSEYGSEELFVPAPYSHIFSRLMHNMIFDAVNSEEDFRRIRSAFEKKVVQLYNAAYRSSMKPIIVADDDLGVRRSCEIGLREITAVYPAKVEYVENGIDLLQRVKQSDYGLIITDNSMPGMNGLEAIEEIRKFNQKVPIIMMSASNVKEKALKAGASDYIGKPFTCDQFDPLVQRLYKGA
ncbi:response regulator [Candidatus Woesearchaeota archaeon]|nr:response regulator [Candidatus Woesearchaeota archaeon]